MKVPEPRRLKSGTWFIQLRLNGESISVTAATERECRRQAALVKAEVQSGRKRAGKATLTLREACSRYIDKRERAGASPETIRGYTVIMENRFQGLMDRPVSLNADWQGAYDKDAARLTPKTMANSWSFIRSVCRKECGIELPEITTLASARVEHAFLDPDQVKIFVAATAGDKYRIPLLLCLSSCRSSEMAGLTWDDVDLEHNRIHIREVIVKDKHGKRVRKARTKTDASTRYIPIFIPELRAALEAVDDKTGPVAGAVRDTIYRHANAICEEAGLPQVGLHGLRHSFASLCYSLEIPLKITMQIGGWENDKVVSEIYTHLDQAHVDRQIGKLEQFFR